MRRERDAGDASAENADAAIAHVRPICETTFVPSGSIV
jgi:hypothetical protein